MSKEYQTDVSRRLEAVRSGQRETAVDRRQTTEPRSRDITSRSEQNRIANETVVSGDFPLPGRDVPADPSQEFIDRSPDPSDVVSSSTSTAVDSGGATVDQPSTPTINDGFDSPTIEKDEPGFDAPREFPVALGVYTVLSTSDIKGALGRQAAQDKDRKHE